MPPPLLTDTIHFTSDEAQAMQDLFGVLCRARTVYGLAPHALAEIVSVVSAEVLGRLLVVSDEWLVESKSPDSRYPLPNSPLPTAHAAVFLEGWTGDTQRRALDVWGRLQGEGAS